MIKFNPPQVPDHVLPTLPKHLQLVSGLVSAWAPCLPAFEEFEYGQAVDADHDEIRHILNATDQN